MTLETLLGKNQNAFVPFSGEFNVESSLIRLSLVRLYHEISGLYKLVKPVKQVNRVYNNEIIV